MAMGESRYTLGDRGHSSFDVAFANHFSAGRLPSVLGSKTRTQSTLEPIAELLSGVNSSCSQSTTFLIGGDIHESSVQAGVYGLFDDDHQYDEESICGV